MRLMLLAAMGLGLTMGVIGCADDEPAKPAPAPDVTTPDPEAEAKAAEEAAARHRAEDAADKIESGAKELGEGLEEGAKATGEKIEEGAKEAGDEIKEGIDEIDRELNEESAEPSPDQAAAVDVAEEKVNWFGRQLATMREKSAQLKDKASEQYNTAMGNFEQAYDQASDKLARVKRAGGEAWREAKPELDEAVTNVKQAYEKATAAFNAQFAEGAGAGGEPVGPAEGAIEK